MTTRKWLDRISTETVSQRFLFYTHINIQGNQECVVINNSDIVYKSRYHFHVRGEPRKLNIRYVNLASISDEIKIEKLETADRGKFIDLVLNITMQVKDPIGVLLLGEKPVQSMCSYLVSWCHNIIKRYKLDKLDEGEIADAIKKSIMDSHFYPAFSINNLLVRYQDISQSKRIATNTIKDDQDIEVIKKDFEREQQEQQAVFALKIKATSENAAEELRQQKVRFDNEMEEYKRKYERDMEEMRLAVQKLVPLAQISKEDKQQMMDTLKILATTSTSGGNISDIIKIFRGIGGVQIPPSPQGTSNQTPPPPLIAENLPQKFEACFHCGATTTRVGAKYCSVCGREI